MRTLGKLIVVEDEPLIALMLEDMAREIGWDVLGSAASEADAFALLRSTSPSAAILDINLGLSTSYAVASACRDRHIPVVFVTGYHTDDVRRLCGNSPILTKPFAEDEMADALGRIGLEAGLETEA